MRRFMTIVLIVTLGVVCQTLAADNIENNVINVAQSKWGATATASSEFGTEYKASNVLDGSWSSRITDKWNSAAGDGPHWLQIDLGSERVIDRIVIRHEGVLGGGEMYNTADYRIQKGSSSQGPWSELVSPVIGNSDDITTHEFSPTKTRYVRLLIEKGEQNNNQFGRIFEFEIYSDMSDADWVMFGIDFPDRIYREKDGQVEVLAQLEYILPGNITVEANQLAVRFGEFEIKVIDDKPQFWMPATGEPLDFIFLRKTLFGESELARKTVTPPPPVPNYFFDGGTVHIMSSSHQDIAWENSPQFCRNGRDKDNVTPTLEMMNNNKEYRFTVETMMYLMDELEDHPERKEEVYNLTKEGQLQWGATYTQPYESFLSGEQMIRGMYLGRKWLHKTFPDCDAVVAWNPDVPGRAMQMPQILSKAGIPYLIFSRHEKGIYNWQSPDGTGVTAYSLGHYGNDHFNLFSQDPERAADQLRSQLEAEGQYYKDNNIEPQYGLLNSVDLSKPTDFGDLIREFETKNSGSIFSPPKVRYSSAREYFEQVTKGNPNFKTITGERPNVWLYIHGPGHHRAASASRDAGVLLPAAETFATINCLLDGSFDKYPTREFFDSWKAACFPDHGWGGRNGHITDALFKEKLEYARDKGQQILDRSLNGIASQVKTDTAKGKPLVVFNTLSWQRSGVVTAEIAGLAKAIHVIDSCGQVVPHQLLPSEKYGKSKILFLAEEMPSTGYKTYYVVPGKKDAETVKKQSATNNVWENKFYKLTLTEGGVRSIYDKQLKQEILRPDKFLGGEVFTMQSVGNGAGEFIDIQQPTMEGFDKVSGHKPKWTLSEPETGSVQTVFKLTQKMTHCTVMQKLVLFNDIKKIDFEVSLLDWDGTQSREFRMALPVNADNAKIAYEVAMGVLEVGKDEIEGAAGERYTTPCKDVHPREVQNFITASNDKFGVTMSSSVSVCDWIDPTTDAVGYPVLQPILLASRKSCHWEGPWYLQTGDHHYRFSVFSHRTDWKNGYRFGIESNTPLQVVAGFDSKPNATLPDEKSFFSVSANNVVISTIKKCDDDDSVIARLYDIEGRDSEVKLNTFFDIEGAEYTNIIEEEGEKIHSNKDFLEIKVGHHAIETFKLYANP